MRAGQKQKKIDIKIPNLDDFIHKTYINVARKIYKNVYLFETNIQPLQIQKNYRELEIIVQEGILNTLRDSIPVEAILKAYMDETIEENVTEEIKEQIIEEQVQVKPSSADSINNSGEQQLQKSNLKFNDIDYVATGNGNITSVSAPKNIERLEEISEIRNQQRKAESEGVEDSKIKISDQNVELDILDIHNIEEPKIELLPDLLIDDIEVLE
jgi:hypothetical protein